MRDRPPLGPETRLFEDDVLDVLGTEKAVHEAMSRFRLSLLPVEEAAKAGGRRWASTEVGLAEVLITPRSAYIGKTVREGQIGQKFGVQVLSIRRRDERVSSTRVPLKFGDSLLVRGTWDAIGALALERRNFVVVGSPEEMARGRVGLLARGLVGSLGQIHPLALMAGVFLLTTAFSQVISNTARTVLVAPIVLKASLDLGLAPQPMLMAVAVSALTAFLTPIGTTTNLLVYSPGGYRFSDYWKTGLPLIAIYLAMSLLLIPLIWPL